MSDKPRNLTSPPQGHPQQRSIHDPIPVEEPTKRSDKSKMSHTDDGVEILAAEENERGHIAGFYHGAPGVKHHYHHKK